MPTQQYDPSMFSGLTNLGGNLPNTLMEPLPFLGGALTRGAQQILPQGMANLANIMASQGRTDPRLFNQMRTNIEQRTQAAQQQGQGRLAQMGLGGSKLGQMFIEARGLGGRQQLAGLDAQEAQLQEQRQRQDMNLLNMLMAAIQGNTQMGVNQFNTIEQQRDQNRLLGQQSGLSALGALLGGAGSAGGFRNLFGGGG